MKKRLQIITLFICILIFIVLFGCNKLNDDIFSDSLQSDDIKADGTFETHETTNELNGAEAYEKYGLLSFTMDNNYDRIFDGTYIYGLYLTDNNDLKSRTLGKYEYPDGGEWTPVCTDPLCSHKTGSGCPFLNSTVNLVCYEGKLYFLTDNGTLCVYDKTTNKSTSLKNGCYNCRFYKYDGELYFVFSEENDDFDNTRVFTKILPDSKVDEIGRLDEVYDYNNAVYKDKYAVDYKSKLNDGGGTISVLIRDLKSKEIKTVAEIDCPGAVNIDAVQTYNIYSNKLLLKTQYYMIKHITNDRTGYDDLRNDAWLIDLSTGEKRLICSPDVHTYKTYAYCLYSCKCVMWYDPRLNGSDPLILHVLFPYTGEEKEYDISDAVLKETGETIPLDNGIFSISGSAVVLSHVVNDRSQNTYKFDLESGRVYKYAQE